MATKPLAKNQKAQNICTKQVIMVITCFKIRIFIACLLIVLR